MCITEAIRVKYNNLTDNDIAEYTSKWLSQATVRVQRDEKKYVHFICQERHNCLQINQII